MIAHWRAFLQSERQRFGEYRPTEKEREREREKGGWSVEGGGDFAERKIVLLGLLAK